MKEILITGGAGFIASHLAPALLKKGYRVVAVDNFHLGKKENIAHLLDNKNFSFEKLDVLDKDKIKKLFRRHSFETVYHLAANSDISRGSVDRTLDLDLNLLTTISVLDAMVESGCKKLVFASTSAIFGEKNGRIAEDTGSLAPASFYGASKLAAEAYIAAYSNMYNIQAWITRFPNIVGKRATHGVLFDFLGKLRKNPNTLEVLGDGNQSKPYLHAQELVEAIELFVSRAKDRWNTLHIGVESSTTVKEIAEMVVQKVNPQARIRYTGGTVGWKGDVARYEYDLTKIHTLGWKAKLTSTEAVKRALDEMCE